MTKSPNSRVIPLACSCSRPKYLILRDNYAAKSKTSGQSGAYKHQLTRKSVGTSPDQSGFVLIVKALVGGGWGLIITIALTVSTACAYDVSSTDVRLPWSGYGVNSRKVHVSFKRAIRNWSLKNKKINLVRTQWFSSISPCFIYVIYYFCFVNQRQFRRQPDKRGTLKA